MNEKEFKAFELGMAFLGSCLGTMIACGADVEKIKSVIGTVTDNLDEGYLVEEGKEDYTMPSTIMGEIVTCPMSILETMEYAEYGKALKTHRISDLSELFEKLQAKVYDENN